MLLQFLKTPQNEKKGISPKFKRVDGIIDDFISIPSHFPKLQQSLQIVLNIVSKCPRFATRRSFAAVATVEDTEVVEFRQLMGPWVSSGGY